MHSGTFGTDDGRRPTDQMNGVMNDEDELPPQVTARSVLHLHLHFIELVKNRQISHQL